MEHREGMGTMARVVEHLASLETAGLVRQMASEAEVADVFRHALVRDAAYGSLLKDDRRRLHRLVGEAIERSEPGRLDSPDLAPLLGEHFLEAGDDPRASKYFTLAGDASMHRYALAEAIGQYTHALEAAGRLGDRAATRELRTSRGRAYEVLGDFGRARGDYETALDEARAVGDRRAEWRVLIDLGALWASRDYARTGDYYRHALDLARTIGDRPTLAHSLNHTGNWHLNVDEPGEGLRYHREALTLFEDLRDPRGLAETLDMLGMASYLGADVAAGTAYLERAVAIFRELDDRQGVCASLSTLGLRGPNPQTDALPTVTPLDEAGLSSEMALEGAREIGWRSGEAFALTMLAFCRAAQGEYAAALEMAQAGLRVAQAIEHRQWMVAGHYALGIVYRDLLDLPEGCRHLETALALARETGSVHWMRSVTGQLATAYILDGRTARAESVLEDVMSPDTPARSVGQRQVWCARVELCLARGVPSQALTILDRIIAATPLPAGPQEVGRGVTAMSSPPPIIRIARLRGSALAMLGELSEAEAAYRAAQAIARTQGARAALWRIGLALGNLYLSSGRSSEAAEELAAARELVEQLATGVPDAALREKFLRRAGAMFPG